MDPGKERFLRNFDEIKQFAVNGRIPVKNVWDFINAIADLFYNFRREKVVKSFKASSPTFKRFIRKNVSNRQQQTVFFQDRKHYKSSCNSFIK